MPNWSEVLGEIRKEQEQNPNANPFDTVRNRYLTKVSLKTGRNLIAYYSGWLQKPKSADAIINDKDKSGLMLTIHRMDRTKGLDLILHTPGGDLAATESLVDYLRSMFGNDIRVIIPQIAMSAGTMIALSAREVVMGKHSNLGPIDPQMGGLACQAILAEFEQAKADIRANPQSAALWQVIIGKYHPTLLGSCKQAIEWSEQMVSEWLSMNMAQGDDAKRGRILQTFSDHEAQKSHARHISRDQCVRAGVTISELETDSTFQDLVLTTHHVFMHTFSNTTAIKIIENHMGVAFIEQLAQNSRA
jgi:hypothetical protein